VWAADFVAFDCTSQEKAAHGHVVYAVQEAPFLTPFCPGNERYALKFRSRSTSTTAIYAMTATTIYVSDVFMLGLGVWGMGVS